jgi:hypothetical protein
MAERSRGGLLTAFAILFGVLAISNLLKPLELSEQTGFVLFGFRLKGTANLIAGPLFGLYLLAYAAGIWRMKRYSLSMGWAYAAYVVVNLVLYGLIAERPPGIGYVFFMVVYSVVAIGVSSGAVIVLNQRRNELT